MKTNRYLAAAVAVSLAVLAISLGAQTKGLSKDAGEVGLGLALRHLTNTGIFLYTGAHPDDENNGLMVMLQRGQGYRTALFTCTRGSGGQNEIGPELFESLAVLRTEELASVHAWDGSEQYFGREIDFGFSFSIDETFEKWGLERVTSDYVRIMRMVRPDVIVTMRPEGEGGGQHHQAQARVTGEAFRLAADPATFAEQLKEGLRPWQPRKLYYSERFGFRGEASSSAGPRLTEMSSDVYDPLLGQTYVEIGGEARSSHKCQGMAQLLPLPGPQATGYRLGDSALPGGKPASDRTLFDGVDTSLPGLARFVTGDPPNALTTGLAAIAREAESAQKTFADAETTPLPRDFTPVLKPLAAGLTAVRSLRAQLASILPQDDEGRFEIDFRLATKQDEFEKALVLAQGIRIDVLADDGLVFGGQPIKTTTIVANRGESPVRVERVSIAGLEGDAGCKTTDVNRMAVYRCESNLRVPSGARLTTPYWHPIDNTARYEFDPDVPFGAPFRPTPFRARIELAIAGVPVPVEMPVEYRYEGNIFTGEKRSQLLVVPRYSVSITPDIAIVPSAAVKGTATSLTATRSNNPGNVSGRELRVTVVNGNKGPAKAEVLLQVPAGWGVQPASAPVEFAREDESDTVRFIVTPAATSTPGEYTVHAAVRADDQSFDQGYEVIEYPHIHRQHRVHPADTAIKVIDVKVAPGLKVGYVMGVGDQVPPAIQQLGVQLEMLGADELAWGNLSKYDAIVTGVRAYERRADLRANNHRLIDYASGGGTLVVQYNKFEFNEAQYGPYPAKVSSNRVTDENAPVAVLAPADPIFSFPNRIGDAAWKGWVQERGLYFLGDDKDARYIDLVQTQDPFPYNRGIKKGALVEAKVGRGRWIYVGLGLWRQLPAGTDGAYQLLANILSVGKAVKPVGSRQ
jgi:LmbE family N-acetylglucosaminyl deacetylase